MPPFLPLAASLWSRKITTDGAGVAQIPPLEAGRHTVRVAGVGGEFSLLVPPIGNGNAKPGSLRITAEKLPADK